MTPKSPEKKARNPSRPLGSLQQRLLTLARIARRRADEASDEALRMRLLQKAKQSERSAAIKNWLRSPGTECRNSRCVVRNFPILFMAQDLFSHPSHRM
jgi:hypothetical protein